MGSAPILSKIMVSALTGAMPPSCSAYSSGCTAPRSTRAPASGWQPSNALSIATAGACGPKPRWAKGRLSTLRSKEDRFLMANQPVEILLVEDDPDDVELTLRALRPQRLASKVHVLHDGAEALDYFFAAEGSPERPRVNDPKV